MGTIHLQGQLFLWFLTCVYLCVFVRAGVYQTMFVYQSVFVFDATLEILF